MFLTTSEAMGKRTMKLKEIICRQLGFFLYLLYFKLGTGVGSALSAIMGDNAQYTEDGPVDIKGKPVLKSKTGSWRASIFILGTECGERLAYYGIVANFVTYFTSKLHEGNASAARNVTTWQGTCYLTTLVGAFLADAYWGRYWTIGVFTTIHFFGMCTLTLSASVPAFKPPECVGSFCPSATPAQCQRPSGSPLTRVCQVVVASLRKCKFNPPQDISLLHETSGKHSAIEGSRKLEHTEGLRCLDKAAILSDEEMKSEDVTNKWTLCTITQVEELKILIRMLPIWATTVIYSAVFAQMTSLFVLQGKVMDRTVGPFTIPAASLAMVDIISGISCVVLCEKIIVRIARKFTGKERGFSDLQRIGIGLFISALAMVTAALLEMRCLQLAKELDLVDENTRGPIKILWQIPQYFLMGAADVFAYVGKLEFFYNESPDAMRSLCTALHLLITTTGNYLGSLILTIMTCVTTVDGGPGWIPDNLNKGHLDYLFWLWVSLSLLNLLAFAFCAIKYNPKKAS